MKAAPKFFLFIFLFAVNNFIFAQTNQVKVHNSEVYELANIVLAITPYGKTDPWEVYKNSNYYKDVIAHFDKYADHPLILKTNYSREEWDKFLSFRTDSYGFEFDDNGALKRKFHFSIIDSLNEFEENIDLINDFVKVSGFRDFYKKHTSYYDKTKDIYEKTQMIPEILSFLEEEFNLKKTTSFSIVISPLINRMNCQKTVEEVPTSFITLPEYMLDIENIKDISAYNIASNLHMLFTEIDHDFVNPTTEKYKNELSAYFSATKWDLGSGYEKYPFATFNEYMTWAVYDIFVLKYFPQVATEVIKDWQLQNESRKFFASSLFSNKLQQLYHNKKKNETIADLYPKILKWCKKTQDKLSLPTIVNNSIEGDKMSIVFSEKMKKDNHLDALLVVRKEKATSKIVNLKNIQWSKDGKTITFDNPFESGFKNELYFNAKPRTKTIFQSHKGINLTTYTKIE